MLGRLLAFASVMIWVEETPGVFLRPLMYCGASHTGAFSVVLPAQARRRRFLGNRGDVVARLAVGLVAVGAAVEDDVVGRRQAAVHVDRLVLAAGLRGDHRDVVGRAAERRRR